MLEPGFNGTCTSTTGCLSNLTCLSVTEMEGTCGCDNTQYHNDNNCIPKGGYGDSCITTADSCNVVNGSCYMTKCSCNENYYTDNNMCNSVDGLKPTGVGIEGTATSSNVTIKWTVPTKDSIQSFNIKGNGPNIEKTQLNKNFTAVTIAGLTPNTQYTDIKVETVVKTDRNSSLVVTSDPPFINFTTSSPDGERLGVEGLYRNNNQCNNDSNNNNTIKLVSIQTTISVIMIKILCGAY
ncbi:hypothetical protein LOTGIDRAFT_169282 [Lottia gigantea]|uniref:Fibronectin type-III domain-containing protein n=1 Tax=Lottia gigantea TaxID=225164 RepID=V3YZ54_LOTGI|nr:hypothetical protein LOTGIDRAFT_169282 [Lottia gigantea]ESO83418.1 hypothetical protein LOTGIDRAFT_169282 [Lottia gigantea]